MLMSGRRFARNMRDNRFCHHEGCKRTAKVVHLKEGIDGNTFSIVKTCRRHSMRSSFRTLETQSVPSRRCCCCHGKDTFLVAFVGYDYSYDGQTGEPVIDV